MKIKNASALIMALSLAACSSTKGGDDEGGKKESEKKIADTSGKKDRKKKGDKSGTPGKEGRNIIDGEHGSVTPPRDENEEEIKMIKESLAPVRDEARKITAHNRTRTAMGRATWLGWFGDKTWGNFTRYTSKIASLGPTEQAKAFADAVDITYNNLNILFKQKEPVMKFVEDEEKKVFDFVINNYVTASEDRQKEFEPGYTYNSQSHKDYLKLADEAQNGFDRLTQPLNDVIGSIAIVTMPNMTSGVITDLMAEAKQKLKDDGVVDKLMKIAEEYQEQREKIEHLKNWSWVKAEAQARHLGAK